MRIAIASDAWAPQTNGVVTTLKATVETITRLGHEVRVKSVPKALTALGISVRQRLGRGGLSRDALDVITAHTTIDPLPAATALGIQLTGIDEMIRSSLGKI